MVLAICDQFLFAGASFAFTLLLGRWLSQEDFGAFSVAYSIFILLQNIFEPLILEPFTVFSSGKLAPHFNAYMGRIVYGYGFVAGVLTLIALIISVIFIEIDKSNLSMAFLGMALAIPFLLGRLLIRQPFYIVGRIHWSVINGMIYIICSSLALCLLRYWNNVTPFAAFLSLGFGSLVVIIVTLSFFLKPMWHTIAPELAASKLIKDHISYGSWAIGERLLLWLQGNVFFLVLPLNASASYRVLSAMMMMPAGLIISAVMGVLLPVMVRAQNSSNQTRWIKFLIPNVIILASLYAVVLILVGQHIAHLVFAGKYDDDITLTLLIASGGTIILFSTSAALELLCRAQLFIRQILIARVIATAFLLTCGTSLILVLKDQVLGAIIALGSVWLTTVVVLTIILKRRRTALISYPTKIADK